MLKYIIEVRGQSVLPNGLVLISPGLVRQRRSSKVYHDLPVDCRRELTLRACFPSENSIGVQAVGMLFKRGSTISAAEGGCQAEVGGEANAVNMHVPG